MRDPLIPEAILESKDHEIRELIKSSDQTYAVDIDDDLYGQALRRYLLFSQWPTVLQTDVPELNDELVLYNTYYWLKRFSKLYKAKHGHDAGLEDQAIELLTYADCEFDWSVIEQIEHKLQG